VHAYIVYQLLARRIQRDLLLFSALIASSPSSSSDGGRLYPAIVKLLDSVLQSLEQMRALSVVDDSPDIASAVDTRLYFTKARRYVPPLPFLFLCVF
jgi:signal recognition particle subunit SRP68